MAMVIVARCFSDAGCSGFDSTPFGGFSAGVNVGSAAASVLVIVEARERKLSVLAAGPDYEDFAVGLKLDIYHDYVDSKHNLAIGLRNQHLSCCGSCFQCDAPTPSNSCIVRLCGPTCTTNHENGGVIRPIAGTEAVMRV